MSKPRKVIITGGSSGLGLALAEPLLRRGDRVTLLARDPARLAAAMQDLQEKVPGAELALADIRAAPLADTAAAARALGVKVSTRRVDVAQREEVEAWAAATAQEHGGCDIVINNAGVALLDTLEDVPYDQFHWVFDILYWGVVHGTRAFLPLVRARRGTIANMGSIHSFIAAPNNGPYCAAKSAVRGFCDALREEVRGDEVNVLLIMPGGIRTEIVRNSQVNKFINPGASQEDVHRAHNAACFTSAEEAAVIILRAIRQRRARVLVGWDAVFYDWLTRLLPTAAHRLYAWGARKLAVAR